MLLAWISSSKVQLEKCSSHKQTPPEPKNHLIAQICYLSYFYLKCNKFNYCSKVLSLPQENKKYTYADYLAWPEEERFELIDGIPYMQAAPSWQHQSISTELITQFSNYLKNKPYRVFHAPLN